MSMPGKKSERWPEGQPETLDELVKFPVKDDGMECYIYDSEHHMLLSTALDDEDKGWCELFAKALNFSHGHGDRPETPTNIKLPIHLNQNCTEIWDAKSMFVINVRGWGRLQYLGEKEGEAAQRLIGQAFVDAVNALNTKL